MPTVEPGSRVLVTGANGYIAMWIIRFLLEQGFRVRGVVRSQSKGKHLKEYFGSYGDKFELFIAEDIAKEGAFDEAVKDVDAIEHTVAYVSLAGIEPDEYIKPALQGTLNVLNSALKFGNKVKRIVITSSVAAIFNPVDKPTAIFDETSWGDYFVEYVKQKGKEAGPIIKYSASKTLAEKAAWDLYHKHRNEITWDLTVIHPPYVFGPTLQDVRTPETLNESMSIFWNIITKDQPEEVLKQTVGVVDVRDVALGHVEALRKEAAGGERIIISETSFTWQGIRNFIHSLRPDLYDSGLLPRGDSNLDTTPLFLYNADKGKRILGMRYTATETMVNDTLADFEARGWLGKVIN